MEKKRRNRLAVIWSGFVLAIGYVTFADGFAADLGDLLGVLLMALGAALVYVYYANPGDVLSFGTEE